MTAVFWAGIAVFVIGFVLRYVFKFQYYRDYRDNARTEMQRQEMKAKYRKLIFIGLAVEVIGCIICIIGVW